MKIDWKKEIKLPNLSSRSKFPKRQSAKASGLRPMVDSAKVNARDSKAPASRPTRARPNVRVPALLSGVKAPKFASDIYADLRDRQLLPLVALLLVAIVAVPILLKNSSSEPTPAAATNHPAPQVRSSDASFSVVPAETGLRDYRKRLGHRQARDPFNQPSADLGSAASASGGKSGGGGTTEESGGSASPTEGSSESGASATETTPSAGTPQSLGEKGTTSPGNVGLTSPSERGSNGGSENAGNRSEGSTGEAGGSVNQPHHGSSSSHGPSNQGDSRAGSDTIVEKEITGYAISAKSGSVEAEKLQSTSGIKEMTTLPSPKQPVAVYLGVGQDKKGALFLLGTQVTAYYGHGRCTLDKQSCSVLEVRPGKAVTLAYGVADQRFKIVVDAIEPEVTTTEVTIAAASR
jgi:hypothetical protein